ncbi:MAG: MBL fold metallo-hydrolase [Pseudomonadota bacterium]
MPQLVLLLLCVCMLPACGSFLAAPAYQGPVTDRFNGKHFINEGVKDKGLLDVLALSKDWIFKRQAWPDWVDATTDTVTHISLSKQLSSNGKAFSSRPVRIQYINHSTFLIQFDDLTVLTDPVFSERVSPFSWIGPKRVHAPAVTIDALPHIDVVLISHNHYDHLDIDALKRITLRQATRPPLFLAGLGNAKYLTSRGLQNVRDLDWYDQVALKSTSFYFTPAQHRSGRGLSDQMKTLWGSFLIKRGDDWRLYFAGDTGYSQHFKALRNRFGVMDVSLLPIGAYEPRWFMKGIHMDPKQAVQAHIDLGSRISLGMHFGAFQLTLESREQPLIDLSAALLALGVPTSQFVSPEVGASYVVSQ